MSGLYVPGDDGTFKFREAAQAEEQPIMAYEQDTGRLFVNFNLVFSQQGRKAQDVIIQTTPTSRLGGVIITSVPLGPEELAARNEAIERRNQALREAQHKR